MPPGQAKQWRLGYPLGPDITFYDLDRNLRIRLGDPPDGYRYVRVASDILLLAVGTNMVVDAIENLGRY
jgi:Ni/Co efflux regulator RcnB